LADCIAQPNVGTGLLSLGLAGIVYGVNGVCHQMANRILSAANIELPLTFAQIRASRFTYRGGAFGRNLPGQPVDANGQLDKSPAKRRHLLDNLQVPWDVLRSRGIYPF
jgi:hypothetical protein